jgi:polyisoprenoid-binding protein YceI
MNKSILIGFLATALTGAVSAAPTTFDFKDPKNVNTIQFKLDAPLEPISGSTNGVTGTVSFDPQAPEATTGKIVVATKSLTTPNAMMTEHLVGPNWIDAAKHPEIVFEITKLSDLKGGGNSWTAQAAGKFTLHGVTKDISVPVKLTYLADSFGKRINKPEVKGDLLVVRSDFTIERDDFGIQPGKNEDKVSNEIALSVAIVGGAPKS